MLVSGGTWYVANPFIPYIPRKQFLFATRFFGFVMLRHTHTPSTHSNSTIVDVVARARAIRSIVIILVTTSRATNQERRKEIASHSQPLGIHPQQLIGVFSQFNVPKKKKFYPSKKLSLARGRKEWWKTTPNGRRRKKRASEWDGARERERDIVEQSRRETHKNF